MDRRPAPLRFPFPDVDVPQVTLQFPRMTAQVRRILIGLGSAWGVSMLLWIVSGFSPESLASWWVRPLSLQTSAVFSGRVWQLVTYAAVYLPQEFVRLLLDALLLYLFACQFESQRGGKLVLRIALTAIPMGALGHLLWTASLGGAWPYLLVGTVSGPWAVTSALVAAWCWETRRANLQFFGVRMNGWGLLAIFVVFDLVTALTTTAIHLGPQLAGIATGLLMAGGGGSLRRRLVLWRQRRRLKVVAGKDARHLLN